VSVCGVQGIINVGTDRSPVSDFYSVWLKLSTNYLNS